MGSYFQSKKDEIKTTIEFCLFKLVFVSNFILKKNNFQFLDQICPRMIFMVKNKNIEHNHCIAPIQGSLGTKFQLKLTVLIFFEQIYPKRIFWSKTEKVKTTYFLCNSAYSD